MFEGRFWEFALLIVIALVVFGPERLPQVARTVGLWVGRARTVLRKLSEQIEREGELDELRRSAAAAQRAVRDPLGAVHPGEPSADSAKHEPPTR
ncbi:MAG: Sec-independent protein translocase protein TatB [Gammaproteobacteria bacterium]